MRLKVDSIRARHSVRTYDGMPLSSDEERALRDSFAEAVPGPFGAAPRFILATRDEIEDAGAGGATAKGRVRIGTYGMIVGPRAFIAGAWSKEMRSEGISIQASSVAENFSELLPFQK